MDAVGRAMLCNAPGEEYLGFVDFHRSSTLPKSFDPFARDFLQEAPEVHVNRRGVAQVIYNPGDNVITGLRGAGKATLCRRADILHNRAVLTVPWSGIPEQACLSKSALVAHLVPRLVQAFWSELGRLYKTRTPDADLMDDSRWEQILCSFYTKYPPATDTPDMRNLVRLLGGWCTDRHRHFSGDQLDSLMELIQGPQHSRPSEENKGALREQICRCFDLEELRSLCFDLSVDPDDISGESRQSYARELIDYFQRRLRTNDLFDMLYRARPKAQWERFSGSLKWPFDGVRLLVDIPDTMSQLTQLRLIDKLSSLNKTALRVTIFAPGTTELEFDLHKLRAFTGFRLTLYRLPVWTEEELADLLLQRGWSGGVGEPDEMFPALPEDILRRSARKKLPRIIARSATRTYALNHPVDAPIHALNLAHHLLGACAKRWHERQHGLPRGNSRSQGLGEADLWMLCNRYWDGVKESGY
jgi:hypothetical protein